MPKRPWRTSARRALQAKTALANLQGEDGPVKGVTSNLQQTLTSARDVMADMAETTEALKHNFLVRGFFNRRGYFDLADVSVDAVSARACSRTRSAARCGSGFGPSCCSSATPRARSGSAIRGADRLDSAMSQFVRYPRTSPIVVEGYAQEPTADQRFLLSRSRGQLVRDYIREPLRAGSDDHRGHADGIRGRGQPFRRHLGRRRGWRCSCRPVRQDNAAGQMWMALEWYAV